MVIMLEFPVMKIHACFVFYHLPSYAHAFILSKKQAEQSTVCPLLIDPHSLPWSVSLVSHI